jgi:hypothetical protein
MMPTADPLVRLRRLRLATLAAGIAMAALAAAWAIAAPAPAGPDAVANAPLAAAARPVVHPERWRVNLAPAMAPPPAAPPTPPVAMTLISVMSRGDRRNAMITVGDGRLVTVAVAATVEGWTVTAIEERSVDLAKDGVTRRLEMGK